MGLILVFDLDQTIIDSNAPELFMNLEYPMNKEYQSIIKKNMNPKVVDILLKAAKLRGKGVDAICLLTNNSIIDFVAKVDSVLLELSNNNIGKFKKVQGSYKSENIPGEDFFFDVIMTANNPMRLGLTKSLYDIQTMMLYLKIPVKSTEELLSRLYFFDDVGEHVLRSDFYEDGGINIDHYIHITPRFRKGVKDETDYTPILTAFNTIKAQMGGGKKRKHSVKLKRRGTLKKLPFK